MKSHFTISRHFGAARQRVWDAWTDPEQLSAWFGPKGSTASILNFDLRPGGEWRGRMEGPDGSVMYSKFAFKEIEPIWRLTWVHGFADAQGNRTRAPFAPQFPLELMTTVVLTDEGDGTRVQVDWEPIDASPEETAFFASMMSSMEGGWSGSFDQLDAHLKAD